MNTEVTTANPGTPHSLTATDESHSSAMLAPLPDDPAEQPARWGLPKLIAFRFAFSYLVLYVFPFPIGYLPGTETLSSAYQRLWQLIVPWAARHMLHIGYQFSDAQTGSGDKTYDWVLAFCLLTLAIAATVVWSALDRQRADYQRLHLWLRFYVRIYAGSLLISYGAFKVIQSQFPPPNLTRLLEPYGDSSPMGLLWTFMGASRAYNAFAGAAEMLGGVMLIIPAVATLGALISIAVTANIFVLNLAYDVPVKLFSFHLMVMAAFIALPDVRRLANFFLYNRRVEPAASPPLFQRRVLNRGMLWLQLVFLILACGVSLAQAWQTTGYYESVAVDASLHGIWSVDEFALDGQQHPPLMSDANRWQRVVLEYNYRLSVQFMDAPQQLYTMALDTAARKLELSTSQNPNWHAVLNYEVQPPGLLLLKGQIDGHPVQITMRRRAAPKFQLTTRGFHWISEYPFNR